MNDRNNSKIRVLFIGHTYVVGVNQGKLHAITQTGEVEVALLVPQKWHASQWIKHVIEYPYPEIQVYPVQVWFEGIGGAYLYPPLTIRNAILDFKPDLIQVEEEVFSLSSFEIALFARLMNKPLVFFGWENMDRVLSPLRRWTRQFVLDSATLLIAGNHDGADLLRKWGYDGLVEVMPQMGVDIELFKPRVLQEKTAELCIGFVGRLVYQKGVDLLLRAANLLLQQDYCIKMMICGSGSDELTFKQQAIELGVDQLVTWTGRVRHDEVPQVMGHFDIFVLPSRTDVSWKEQFGHVLIEAMAVGIPVVGSNSGEIPNVIGRKDLVFCEGDPYDLAKILARLISNPDFREAAGLYSLDRVRQLYSHDQIALRSIKLWRRILHK